MWRSLLFAPANRLDLIAKFPRTPADNYVLDLEDGTPAAEKESARERLGEAVSLLRREGIRGRVLVRVNDLASPLGERDLEAVGRLEIDGIVVPKCEDASLLGRAGEALSAGEPAARPRCLVGGIETIRGVVDVLKLARAGGRLAAIYFGAEDLAAEMGARRTREGREVLYARQRVVLAAKAGGIAAIDQAVTDIRDQDLFVADATEGLTFAYDGKICLNPLQARLANEIFTPSAAEAERARRMLEAFEAARKEGRGTIAFEGQMIDEPLVRRARAVVAAFEAAQRS